MEWKTSISTIKDGRAVIRDKSLIALAGENSFVGNIHFILTGNSPTKEVEEMLNVIFSLSIDHSPGTVSTMAARIATSADVPVQQALIAALSTMGRAHGGATEDSAEYFREKVAGAISSEEAVRSSISDGKRIPGYGHKVLKSDDRVEMLFQKAKDLGLYKEHCKFAEEVASEVAKQKGRAIPLNIDGGIAAISLDLGFSSSITTGLFIIGRLPGLIAHIEEERVQKNGLRRLSENDVRYEPGS